MLSCWFWPARRFLDPWSAIYNLVPSFFKMAADRHLVKREGPGNEALASWWTWSFGNTCSLMRETHSFLSPLFQNKSWCTTFHMKWILLACSVFMQIIPISSSKFREKEWVCGSLEFSANSYNLRSKFVHFGNVSFHFLNSYLGCMHPGYQRVCFPLRRTCEPRKQAATAKSEWLQRSSLRKKISGTQGILDTIRVFWHYKRWRPYPPPPPPPPPQTIPRPAAILKAE